MVALTTESPAKRMLTGSSLLTHNQFQPANWLSSEELSPTTQDVFKQEMEDLLNSSRSLPNVVMQSSKEMRSVITDLPTPTLHQMPAEETAVSPDAVMESKIRGSNVMAHLTVFRPAVSLAPEAPTPPPQFSVEKLTKLM